MYYNIVTLNNRQKETKCVSKYNAISSNIWLNIY